MGLRRVVFDKGRILQGWLARLESHRPCESENKAALETRAPIILEAIANYFKKGPLQKVNEPKQDDSVNFEIYSLNDVILECSLLRAEVLEYFTGIGNHAEKSLVFDVFDREIARLGIEAREFEYLQNSILEPSTISRAPQDTHLRMGSDQQINISGAINYGSPKALLHKHRLLKERAELLAEASKVFSGSIDYDEAIRRVAKFALRSVADWCIVDAEDHRQRMTRRIVMHREAGKSALTEELRRDFGPHEEARGVPSLVLRTQQSLLIPRVTDDHYLATTRSPRHEEILRALGSESYMCVPLIARDNLIGAITFVSGSNQKIFDHDDLLFAEELCLRAGLSIDNSIQYQKAQNAIQLREDFIGIVSHDLKNPLQVINLSTELLLTRDLKDSTSIRKLLERVRNSGQQMVQLITDLLDLSKFEAGHFRLDLKREKISQMLLEITESFQPIWAVKGVQLKVECDAELSLSCDRGRLTQAIGNLVSNAIKFTPSGGVVRLEAKRSTDMLELSVSDCGIGITASDLPHLFDRFWQAKSATRRGTGIGLSIVKAMVESHGGTTRVTSVPSVGSTFTILIPEKFEQARHSI